jgi:menaquinone-dependent protoporphyrinogen oxidase
MKILVAVASKHGATYGIARAIAEELEARGLRADAVPLAEVEVLEHYDAVILGSAVYLGKWMSEATKFAEKHAEALRGKPVWLFSSGPTDGRDDLAMTPSFVERMNQLTGAREHRLFAGMVDTQSLGLLEKLAVRAAKSPRGDFRPWDEIRAWAHSIAAALKAEKPSVFV